MIQPNFFIIGAPKCGTTSLATWLAGHANIYMSPVKEPGFYSTDIGSDKITRHEYESLFTMAENNYEAIGEASTSYLFSQVAVPSIEKELPNSRYIVMVRNPVDMAYSFYEQCFFLGYENIKDFAEAWRLSGERAKGYAVTKGYYEPRLLDYKSVCRLGEQLERLFLSVPRERVLVLVLDDVKADPRHEYIKVLEFLGVPDDGRMEFPVKNSAKERRWQWLPNVVSGAGEISARIKKWLGISRTKGTGFLQVINKINTRYRRRTPMTNELRRELIHYFEQDIRLLSRLLDRDLSRWTKSEK